jgi:hypothetical protein
MLYCINEFIKLVEEKRKDRRRERTNGYKKLNFFPLILYSVVFPSLYL